jgi:hypothetical protein
VIHVEFTAQQIGDIRTLLNRLGLASHVHGIMTFESAFGAGAVIAKDPQDDGIVRLSLVANRIQQAPDLVIGMLAYNRRRLPLRAPAAFSAAPSENPTREVHPDAG